MIKQLMNLKCNDQKKRIGCDFFRENLHPVNSRGELRQFMDSSTFSKFIQVFLVPGQRQARMLP